MTMQPHYTIDDLEDLAKHFDEKAERLRMDAQWAKGRRGVILETEVKAYEYAAFTIRATEFNGRR